MSKDQQRWTVNKHIIRQKKQHEMTKGQKIDLKE